MGHSLDLQMKLIAYLARGHTMREAREAYGVSLDTVNRWVQKQRATGSLKDAKPRMTFKKLDSEKLRAHMREHPELLPRRDRRDLRVQRVHHPQGTRQAGHHP